MHERHPSMRRRESDGPQASDRQVHPVTSSVPSRAPRASAARRRRDGEGPAHPTVAAALLMIGIVVIIVVLSALSVAGG